MQTMSFGENHESPTKFFVHIRIVRISSQSNCFLRFPRAQKLLSQNVESSFFPLQELRTAVGNLKYQNHIIYKQLKRVNNKCLSNSGTQCWDHFFQQLSDFLRPFHYKLCSFTGFQMSVSAQFKTTKEHNLTTFKDIMSRQLLYVNSNLIIRTCLCWYNIHPKRPIWKKAWPKGDSQRYCGFHSLPETWQSLTTPFISVVKRHLWQDANIVQRAKMCLSTNFREAVIYALVEN